MNWIKTFFLRMRHFGVKNASHILMTLGTVCSISAVVSAVKIEKAAEQSLYDAKVKKTAEQNEMDLIDAAVAVDRNRSEAAKLTPWEWLKAVGKYYGPAAAIEMLALFCFWIAHGIDIRRQAIWAGVAATAEEALREYQRKTQELIGDKAEKEVRNAIAQDKVDTLPPPRETVILSDDSDLWCIIDGQYFRSSYLKIKEAQNDANHEMIQNMYISQTDLYWLLDPDRKYLKPGPNSGQIGWNVDEMLYLDVDTAMGPEHKPILSVGYRTKDGYDYAPQAGYSRML